MLRINVGEGSFPPENVQCQTGKLARLLRYFTPGNYSDPVIECYALSVSKILAKNFSGCTFRDNLDYLKLPNLLVAHKVIANQRLNFL